MDAPFALFMREDLSVEGMLWTNAMVDPLERRRGASELYEGNAVIPPAWPWCTLHHLALLYYRCARNMEKEGRKGE